MDWCLSFSSLNTYEYSEIKISVYVFCRLMMGKGEPMSLVQELDTMLDQLGYFEDNVGFNFVNSLENLLWAFERRATASWVFQLAIRKSVYRHDIFRYSSHDLFYTIQVNFVNFMFTNFGIILSEFPLSENFFFFSSFWRNNVNFYSQKGKADGV